MKKLGPYQNTAAGQREPFANIYAFQNFDFAIPCVRSPGCCVTKQDESVAFDTTYLEVTHQRRGENFGKAVLQAFVQRDTIPDGVERGAKCGHQRLRTWPFISGHRNAGSSNSWRPC